MPGKSFKSNDSKSPRHSDDLKSREEDRRHDKDREIVRDVERPLPSRDADRSQEGNPESVERERKEDSGEKRNPDFSREAPDRRPEPQPSHTTNRGA